MFIKKPEYVNKILITKKQVQKGIKMAGKWIDENYQDKNPILLGVLKGALPFYGQLITNVSVDITIDYVTISTYMDGIVPLKEPKIIVAPRSQIKGRDLIIVEDVVDTGKSMVFLKKYFQDVGAKSVVVVTMVDKPNNRKIPFKVDYNAFCVNEDLFIIGFGLDYNEKYRNLPYIGEFNKKFL